MDQAAANAPGISLKQALGIPLNVLCFLFLMVLAWGSWAGFFAHPARVASWWCISS